MQVFVLIRTYLESIGDTPDILGVFADEEDAMDKATDIIGSDRDTVDWVSFSDPAGNSILEMEACEGLYLYSIHSREIE